MNTRVTLIEFVILIAYNTLLLMLFGLTVYFWAMAMAVESMAYAGWMCITAAAFWLGRWSLFHYVIKDAS